MKPKTKLQILVETLSTSLPYLTEKQKNYAFTKDVACYAFRSKKEVICFECGHQWPDKTDATQWICPKCGKKLIMGENRKWTRRDCEYFGILTTLKGFQILRLFWVERNCKKGKAADYFIKEVIQNWIAPTGKITVRARLAACYSYQMDIWDLGSKLEIRGTFHGRYNIDPYVMYSVRRYSKYVIRNGFKGDYHGRTPTTFLSMILANPKAETLLKAGQFEMLDRIFMTDISSYWPSIKICLRNNYHISDPGIWCDHVRLLQFFNKDILNAKFVCPVDLLTTHAKIIVKKQKIDSLKRYAELKQQITASEKNFKKLKGKFFGLQFVDGEIKVTVISSVKGYFDEGVAMQHCLFNNEYYTKKDSLIFSATKNDTRLETVEVSLSELKVLQCRGLRNNNTVYHDRIVDLVRANVNDIKKIARAKL